MTELEQVEIVKRIAEEVSPEVAEILNYALTLQEMHEANALVAIGGFVKDVVFACREMVETARQQQGIANDEFPEYING